MGPPADKRVGGGAGGRGDNQAVGLVDDDEVAVDLNLEIDHARDLRFGQHHVVQGFVIGNRTAVATQFAVQHASALDTKISTESAFELLI